MSQVTVAGYDAPSRRKFTVDEFHRLVQAGIVGEQDRVELIDGELVEMVPIGEPHATIVDVLSNALARSSARVIVRTQGPVRLSERSEPVPDIAVLRPDLARYRHQHPGPEDVLLLVEVSDTTLAYDRDIKLSLYAVAGVEEVWIVDVNSRRVEQFTQPVGGIYRQARIYVGSDLIRPTRMSDFSIVVNSLFE